MGDSIKKSAADQLREVAEQQRQILIPINEYKEGVFEYSATNPNAMSDGDEKGKGLNDNSVGSKTDIITRQTLKGINQYNDINEYKNPE